MTLPPAPKWSEKPLKLFRASPKKYSALVGLALVLFVLVGRLIFGSSGPSSASASMSAENSPGAGHSDDDYVLRRSAGGDSALLEWARQPIVMPPRNLFAVPLDYYRRDGEHGGDLSVGAGFWDRLAKSLSAHADQQEQRQILIDNLRIMAGALKLESIVMGSEPSAMVNGEVIRPGDDIAGFRVVRIEPRTLVIERQGVRLAILMD
ncbi:MAG: hypothetical protein ABSF29_00505 [Tepidisphaeraceae bacterium]|jgi:hypothetical protein